MEIIYIFSKNNVLFVSNVNKNKYAKNLPTSLTEYDNIIN